MLIKVRTYIIFDISGEENTKNAKNTILVSDSSDSNNYADRLRCTGKTVRKVNGFRIWGLH